MLLVLKNYTEDEFIVAILNIMESTSPDWDVEEQIKEQSKPLHFFVKKVGTFYFGEICGVKVALWDEYFDLDSDGAKKGLQCFTAAKCVIYTGFALAFEKICKRGDIIVSDCIDGVQTINNDEDKKKDAIKCSFYPDDTRFTPVSSTLSSIFSKDWSGILCTQQRQRKSKVVKGTIMATTDDTLEELFDDDVISQLQKENTHYGLVFGGVSLLKAVKECEKKVIFIHGVGFFVSEMIHNRIKQNWIPTVAESLANYIKFRLEKTVHSHSFFSG